MLRSNRSVINTAVRMMLVEGGCNDIIAEGCKIIHEALAAEMDDEDFLIPDDSDDIVVDGPEPKEEQGTGNKEGKRRRRKQEAAETITADSPAPSRSSESFKSRNLAISQSESKSRNLALTPEQIRQGQSRVLRLIQLRMPPDIPTAVRACLDEGMTLAELAGITGLGYYTLAKCKTGAVTSTVADRFQELFAFPRKTAAQEEE